MPLLRCLLLLLLLLFIVIALLRRCDPAILRFSYVTQPAGAFKLQQLR